jgi:prepilin-type processing-associated H-X9-DG protein
VGTDEPMLWVKNKSLVRRPNERIVFICEGRTVDEGSNRSFKIDYDTRQWIDPVPIRHSGGTTIAYADSHADHIKWQGKETIEKGETIDTDWVPGFPDSAADCDLMRRGIWGRIP